MKNENLKRAMRLIEEASHKAELEGIEVEEWVYALEVRALIAYADVAHLKPVKFLVDHMLEVAEAEEERDVKERNRP